MLVSRKLNREQVEDISMKSTSILQKDVGKSGILEGTNVCVEGSSNPYIVSGKFDAQKYNWSHAWKGCDRDRVVESWN